MAKLSGDENFNAAQATVVLSILNIMMAPLRSLLVSVSSSLSAFAIFDRMQEFLSLDERADTRLLLNASEKSTESPSGSGTHSHSTRGFTIRDGSFKWGKEEVLSALSVASEDFADGSIAMVVGPIGSGKSTFLKSLLGETVQVSGTVSLTATDIAFCDQTPWLMNATIRDNILAQSGDYDEAWYNTVIEACDLNTDLATFDNASDTIVGDRGLKLSGGQKQRMVRQ